MHRVPAASPSPTLARKSRRAIKYYFISAAIYLPARGRRGYERGREKEGEGRVYISASTVWTRAGEGRGARCARGDNEIGASVHLRCHSAAARARARAGIIFISAADTAVAYIVH